MIIYLIIGMLVGLLLAGVAFLTGAGFWTALLVYSLGGAFTVIALSVFAYFNVWTRMFPAGQASQRPRRENA